MMIAIAATMKKASKMTKKGERKNSLNLYLFKNINWVRLTLYFFYLIIQREISNKVQLGENLNPLKDIVKVPAIDNTSNLKDVFKKVNKPGNLWEDGRMDYSLIRYFPGLVTVS